MEQVFTEHHPAGIPDPAPLEKLALRPAYMNKYFLPVFAVSPQLKPAKSCLCLISHSVLQPKSPGSATVPMPVAVQDFVHGFPRSPVLLIPVRTVLSLNSMSLKLLHPVLQNCLTKVLHLV